MLEKYSRRAAAAVTWVLRVASAAILASMVLLTSTDVVLRYWFNSSIRGAYEITQLLLAMLIFAALPLVSRDDQHVVVDLLSGVLGARVKRILAAFAQLVCTIVFSGFGWLMWRKAQRVGEDADVTAALYISIQPFVYFMLVLLIVTVVIHVVKLVAHVSALRSDAALDLNEKGTTGAI